MAPSFVINSIIDCIANRNGKRNYPQKMNLFLEYEKKEGGFL